MRRHHHRQRRHHQRAAAAPDAVYWQQHHARGALVGDSSGEDDAESQLPSQRREPHLIFQFTEVPAMNAARATGEGGVHPAGASGGLSGPITAQQAFDPASATRVGAGAVRN
jgi:hypothetical protein